MFQDTKQKGSVWVAVAIIIAGALIAAAVIFTDGKGDGSNPLVNNKNNQLIRPENNEPDLNAIPDISESDYYRGNPNAAIKIVEYSDIDCPFCKRLHVTFHELLKQYPNDVMWVYRNMPIPSLHPNAIKQAVAAECAGIQGGNDAFWTMLDRLYADDNSASSLTKFATDQGLNIDEFNSCLENTEVREKIMNQSKEADQAGVQGTPFSVVFVPGGEKISIPGAQPINVWQGLVENFISTGDEDSGVQE